MTDRGRGLALRAVLALDVLVQYFFWGAPGLLANRPLADLWGVQMPKDVLYVRLLGAFAISWGTLFLLALVRPQRNLDLLRVGILCHALVGGTILGVLVTEGVPSALTTKGATLTFWWVTIAVNGFLAMGLLLFLPRPAARAST